MSIKTQGTELYFVNDDAVVKLKCPTGISGLGGAKDQIEDTCLDATEDKTFIDGLGNPGPVSVPFNLDPQHASHQVLFDMKEAGGNTEFIICLSDGTSAPTIATDTLTAPTDRTSAKFTAYVSDVEIDISTNAIVTGTLTLQRSGSVAWNWKE